MNMSTLVTSENVSQIVHKAVAEQPITDLHTHLYPANFDALCLRGIDQLLTYHYLIAEVMRWSDIDVEDFWDLSAKEQADLIWKHLFLDHSPISESCRGVLTSLKELGLDPATRDLNEFRKFFAQLTPQEHVDLVLEKANIKHVVMTNDPFNEEERRFWLQGVKPVGPFHAVLRIDPLVIGYKERIPSLKQWGYDVHEEWTERTIAEVRRFLNDWIKIMDPLYMAVSLTNDFVYPDESDQTKMIRDCIIPVCEQNNLPIALMIGVKRKINPALKDAGDHVGKADLSALEYLLSNYPNNKFLVTMLSRENQHELIVLARKFRNLMIFGCWWFLNNPSIIEEMTMMRVEMLGLSMIPQHSDSRVLDQLTYKWAHSRQIIASVLTKKYEDVLATGWVLSEEEIRRDVNHLLHANFWNFIGRPGEV